MPGTFSERAEILADLVGDGDLAGTFRVDAGGRTIPLEVGYWRNFMGIEGLKEIRNYNDGGPHFVGGAIAERHPDFLEDIADVTLETGPEEGMIRAMGEMTEELERRAPIREGSLRQSGAEFVTDGGRLVHESYGASYGQEPR